MTLEEILRRLKECKQVCYDSETSGLDWRHNHVVGHVFTFSKNPNDSYYIPVRHAGGGNIDGANAPSTAVGWKGDVHPVEEEIIRQLDRPGLLVVGHNLSFDLKFLFRLGLSKFKASFQDTQINAAIINERQSSFSLDFCSKVAGATPKKTSVYQYIKSQFPEVTDDKKAMGHFWRLRGDDPETIAYAAGDGTTTWEVKDWQDKEIELNNLGRVHNVESRLIPVLARMTTRGVRIDIERLHEVKSEIIKKRDEAALGLPDGFNPKSPIQVRQLMESHGHTDWPMTAPSPKFPEGQPSFPEEWLKTNPIGQLMVRSGSTTICCLLQ